MRIAIYDRWLATLGGGERMCVSLADHLSRTHEVVFYCASLPPHDALAHRLGIAPNRVDFRVLPSRELPKQLQAFDMFINASQGDLIIPRAKRNVLLVYFPLPIQLDKKSTAVRSFIATAIKRLFVIPSPIDPTGSRRYQAYWQLVGAQLPGLHARLQGAPDALQTPARIVRGYNNIWSISSFTAAWVSRYWQRESDVLTPIVDVEKFEPRPQTGKRNIILSVGRFFAGAHNKKHLEMIAAFRKMALDGWELHLAGGTPARAEDHDYLRQVMDASRGAAVQVHTDLPFEPLRTLYSQSAIYWHAAGLGEDETRDPIRSEHFGITTVEAMASGCVPIVVDKGGQREIVQHGRNGVLWSNVDALIADTKRLAGDVHERERLAAQAIRDSQRYGRANFERRVDELMSSGAQVASGLKPTANTSN